MADHAPRAPAAVVSVDLDRPRNRIQVSREKKPVGFFLNLAKKFLQSEDEVELSGLGLAVTTVVTVAETLKKQEVAVIKKIATDLVEVHEDNKQHPVSKPKIQIWIAKGQRFNELVSSQKPAVLPDQAQADTAGV